jgi:hypothetical protein
VSYARWRISTVGKHWLAPREPPLINRFKTSRRVTEICPRYTFCVKWKAAKGNGDVGALVTFSKKGWSVKEIFCQFESRRWRLLQDVCQNDTNRFWSFVSMIGYKILRFTFRVLTLAVLTTDCSMFSNKSTLTNIVNKRRQIFVCWLFVNMDESFLHNVCQQCLSTKSVGAYKPCSTESVS